MSSNNSIKLSVVIPMFNVRPYIEQAIDSVLNQTLQEIEIIVVNDGSTDGSEIAIRERASRDARVILVDQANGGYGKAVNAGLDRARGEYVSIFEPDDFLEPRAYEILIDAADRTAADVVRCDYQTYHDGVEGGPSVTARAWNVPGVPDGEERWIYLNQTIVMYFHSAAIWSCVYRRHFLETKGLRVRETPGASYQDLPFYMEMLFHLEKVRAINIPLINYRISNPNASSAKGSNKGFLLFDLMDHVQNRMKETNAWKYERFKNVICSSLFIQHYWHLGNLLPELKDDFLKKVRARMIDYEKQGMKPAYLNQNQLEDYQMLRNGGVKTYRKNIQMRPQRARLRPILDFWRVEFINPLTVPVRLLTRSFARVLLSFVAAK